MPCATRSGETRRNLLDNISRQWAQNDPQAALSWAQNLSDPAARNAVLPNIISAVAESDPLRAAQMPDAASRARRRRARRPPSFRNGRRTIRRRPGRWAASFPEGKTRGQIFENLINRWAGNDPTAAASWLGSLSDGPSRDQAVSAFTNRIRSSDPSAAVQWAATIGDDNLRNSQMESTARAWLKTDPRNASTWISNSSLPDDTKSRLLNPGG